MRKYEARGKGLRDKADLADLGKLHVRPLEDQLGEEGDRARRQVRPSISSLFQS
jgi:hypothetical protein